MQHLRLLGLAAAMVMVTACRGVTAPAAPEITPTTLPAPATVPSDSQSYPPPAPALPATVSYPAPPPAALPTASPEAASATATGRASPGDPLWLLHPWGIQCEGPGEYADLAAAVTALEEAGVEVLEAENVDLMVCQACGCATSEHFRVRVPEVDQDAVLAMGWQQE